MKKHNLIALSLAVVAAAGVFTPFAVHADDYEGRPTDGEAVVIEDGKGSAVVHVSHDAEQEEADLATTLYFGTFENTYTADSVYVALSGKKVLNDASKTGKVLAGDDFSFQLKDAKGDVVDEIKNKADGTITFKNIEYTQPGTYTYTIVEVKGTDKHITYDESVKSVTVTVTGENGKLSAKVETKSETPTTETTESTGSETTGSESVESGN